MKVKLTKEMKTKILNILKCGYILVPENNDFLELLNIDTSITKLFKTKYKIKLSKELKIELLNSIQKGVINTDIFSNIIQLPSFLDIMKLSSQV